MAEKDKKPGLLLLTQEQAACFCGITARQFRVKITNNDPPPRDAVSGKYRSDELGQWVRRQEMIKLTGNHMASREAHKGGPSDKHLLSPQQQKARKDAAHAEKAEMENAVRRGELLELSTVQTAGVDMALRVRARLMRIPSAAAPLLLGVEDQIDIQEIVEDQIRDALTELSETWTVEEEENDN